MSSVHCFLFDFNMYCLTLSWDIDPFSSIFFHMIFMQQFVRVVQHFLSGGFHAVIGGILCFAN